MTSMEHVPKDDSGRLVLPEAEIRRFWHYVKVVDDGETCWEWMGSRNPGNYGTVRIAGHMELVHRVSYAFCVGTIPPDLGVLHSCGNRPCCNPSHLRTGTHQENMQDARRSGRTHGSRWSFADTRRPSEYIPIPRLRSMCTIDGCQKPHYSRGWCMIHWSRWYKHGDPLYTRAKSICDVVGCDEVVRSRGLCSMHYERWRRHGDPAITWANVVPPEDRFRAKIVIAPNGCHIWMGKVGKKGHGRFTLRSGYQVGAHRFAYEMAKGPIPSGMDLHHECENPSCCNPDHLKPMTRSDHRIFHDRQTYCVCGHPFDAKNTRMLKDRPGHRACRTCAAEHMRNSRLRKRQEKLAS